VSDLRACGCAVSLFVTRVQYDTQRDANNEILNSLERLEEANHLLQQQNQDYERSMVELRAVPPAPSSCAHATCTVAVAHGHCGIHV
jgi:hypothetical protein